MSGSTLGTLFCVTNFGESHGPAIGCVIDGCPPGLPLSSAGLQPDLDRRRPGTSGMVSMSKTRTGVMEIQRCPQGEMAPIATKERSSGSPWYRAQDK